jgi:mRNA interferase HigB
MTFIGREKLKQFAIKHPDALSWIETWIAEVCDNRWHGPQDIKKRYASASILPDNKVIFNIKGNSYRLEVQFAYNTGKALVKWVGTHSEYDKRCR